MAYRVYRQYHIHQSSQYDLIHEVIRPGPLVLGCSTMHETLLGTRWIWPRLLYMDYPIIAGSLRCLKKKMPKKHLSPFGNRFSAVCKRTRAKRPTDSDICLRNVEKRRRHPNSDVRDRVRKSNSINRRRAT
jgi:hypothetical protein